MKRVLITGANGFLGRALCEFLPRAGWKVRAVVRQPMTFPDPVEMHVLDEDWEKDVLEEALEGVSAVIHLAGRAHKMNDTHADPLREYRRINRDLTLKLASASLAKKIKKFIFSSTVKVMGEQPGFYNLQVAPSPQDPYGVSKMEAEDELGRVFANQTETRCVILRLPMIYGPGNKGNMLPLLKAGSLGLPLPLGDAKGKRSMLFVLNFCDALFTILSDEKSQRPSLQTYFINDGHDLTSRELYQFISRDNKFPIVYFPSFLLRGMAKLGDALGSVTGANLFINSTVVSRLFDPYRFSSEEFCRDYGWTAPFTPEEGIRKTVEWYEQSNRP